MKEKIKIDADRRYQDGEAKYGVFDPFTDLSDFLQKGYEEGLDWLNYYEMFMLQVIRQRPDIWEKIKKDYYVRRNILMELLKMHLELTQKAKELGYGRSEKDKM